MKWRMADVIDQFTPWRMIAGRKAVSLDEYDLLAPLGRSAAFPETLVLECAVAFGRWLVMASSDFTEGAVLDAVGEWRVHRTPGRGDVLHAAITVDTAMPLDICAIMKDGTGVEVAGGRFTLAKLPLRDLVDPEAMRLLWAEMNRNTNVQAA